MADDNVWHAVDPCPAGQHTDVDAGKCSGVPPENMISSNTLSVIDLPSSATKVTFSGPKGSVTVDLKDFSIDMGGNTPPESARAFWNAVMTVVHKPPLFPDDMPK